MLQITVRSPKGDPLRNVKFDFWQADTNGEYGYRSYALRGQFTTDENGTIEVLTVVPGDYGPRSVLRAGHFHIILKDGEGKYESLTTQLYVCKANNTLDMRHDLYVFFLSHTIDAC